MAHYAFLDENNIVVEVITGIDETETIEGLSPEEWYANYRGMKCLRTSYNAKIRKNYAGIGFFYDDSLDAFIPPKPYPSWILDKDSATWVAPKLCPGHWRDYVWNEKQGEWINAETV